VPTRETMSILENEVSKLKKKGYKRSSQKSLKHGKRIILKKKKSGLSGFAGYSYHAYLYSPKDSNAQAITEFLNDFKKYVSDEGLEEKDVHGYFLVKGTFDKVTFGELQKVILKKGRLKNSIIIKQLEMTMEKEKTGYHEEKIKEKIITREITRRSVTTEKVSLAKVVNAIENVPFIKAKRERGYQNQLYAYLSAKEFDVQHEKARRGARFDLVIGDDEIAIELKLIKGTSEFDRLIGQITRYKKQFQKVVVVLIDELKNPSIMKQEVKRLEELDPEKVVVIVR
jgi:hypothetical protein